MDIQVSGGPMTAKSLPPQLLERIAERFRVLAEPLRLQILTALYDREQTVTGLMAVLGQSHANSSKHLQLLYKAGFVERRKAGLHVYYRLANEDVFQLCDIMCRRLQVELDHQQGMLGAIIDATPDA